MFITVKEIAGPDDEVVDCGYIELDADGYLVLPNDNVGSLALSFWVKSNTNANIYVSDKSSTSVNDWRRVSFVFVSDGSDVEIKFSPANYYIYKVKLEKGSKITDWSLSPDDVADGINSLSVRMSKAEQLISPEGIISTVKNSEMYQDDINGIKGRLDEAELKITSDAIVSTVKAGIDGSYLASEINQSAGKVLIKANCIELDGETIAEKLISQTIQSNNYVKDTSGMKLSLADGVWDSKHFKIDSEGSIIATDGKIGDLEFYDDTIRIIDTVTNQIMRLDKAKIIIDSPSSAAHISSSTLSINNRVNNPNDYSYMTLAPTGLSLDHYLNGSSDYHTFVSSSKIYTKGDITCVGTLNAGNIQINGQNLTSLFPTAGVYFPAAGGRVSGNMYCSGSILLDAGGNIISYDQNGLYSQTLGKFLCRAYIAANVWNTALGNNSFNTRIYGSAVWANKAISTSDKRLKKDFENFDERWEKFFFNLEPQTYKMLVNESDRRHTGYLAQQVKESLDVAGITTQEFGGYVEGEVDEQYFEETLGYQPLDENDKQLGLRYEEFIPLNTYMIQKLYKRVEELEAKLANS